MHLEYAMSFGHNCVDLTCQQIGDPALILSVPVEQFREQYVFLTDKLPDDYVNIVAQAVHSGHPRQRCLVLQSDR